jgi:hypothetical protein
MAEENEDNELWVLFGRNNVPGRRALGVFNILNFAQPRTAVGSC